jgi:uncharacterized protein (TIGR04255 family)
MSLKNGDMIDWNETFPHLYSAPIVEAVIDCRARAQKTWKPDDLQKELAQRLPDYSSAQPQHQFRWEARREEDGSSTQTHHEGWHGLRLTSSDKIRIAQFNRDGLVFSWLKPYEDWEKFSSEGLRLWHLFRELMDPLEVQRVRVRFINRFTLAKFSDVKRYLSETPRGKEASTFPPNKFLYQTVRDVADHPFQITITELGQPESSDQGEAFGLILDIDVFTTKPSPHPEKNLEELLPKMRYLKNKCFFTALSKKAIKTLQKGEQ